VAVYLDVYRLQNYFALFIIVMETILIMIYCRQAIFKLFSMSMVSRYRLKLGDVIGEGEFGVVYKGEIFCGSDAVVVAVKTLKGLTNNFC
jgi:hypothetical protein